MSSHLISFLAATSYGKSGFWSRRSHTRLVLPATAKRFVKGHDGELLISLGAGQIKLGREKLLLSFKNFVVTGLARNIALG